MKKYIYLILATVIIIPSIIMSGYALKGSSVNVETLVLELQDMDNTVTSSGKLQYRSGKTIKCDGFGIMKEVYVKSGDVIKKGDRLFSYYQADMAEQYADMGNILGNVSVKEKVIEEVKKYCTVKEVVSETEGKITSVQYSADDIMTKNADVIKLANADILEITVNINENYINEVSVGQKAEITFNAVPDRKYTGKVTKIAEEAVQTTGLNGKETTVAVTVTLDNKKDDKLRIGYSADCSIVTSTDRDIIVVPYECIRSDEKGEYVYTAVKNKAKKMYIKTGNEYKNGAEIVSGLQKGDKIITNSDIYNGQNIIIHNA